MGFPGSEIDFPGQEFRFPGSELPITGWESAFPTAELAFPGGKLPIPGRNLLFPRRVTGIKTRKSNKGAGVPFYDSIATYDSELMYDDPSSPQPNRRRMAKVKLGLNRR